MAIETATIHKFKININLKAMGRCLITDTNDMKTLEQLQGEILLLQEQVKRIENLRNLGVNKADAEKFLCNIPRIYSGYSMGEFVKITYFEKKGKDAYYTHYIVEENHCEAYAKSCKWKPTYGDIRVAFKTKKALNEFIKACNSRDREKTREIIIANLGVSKIYKNDLNKLQIVF